MAEGMIQLPEAFERKMQALLGEEYEAFRKSYEQPRAQGLRLNPLKKRTEELWKLCGERFGLQPVSWCEEGYTYEAQTRPGKHPLHEAGAYYIQEPSAMAVVSLLDPKPGERILDLCAAPGGKTTQIAGRMAGKGLLVSNEIHPARAKILAQNVERMGIGNAVVTNESPEAMSRFFPEFFDRIVVDAPCSGEGMFRKEERARLEWSPENVAACASRQQMILDYAAKMLRPGGVLVYSTCTFSPEEDEQSVEAFLQQHSEFSVSRQKPLAGLSSGRPDWCSGDCPQAADTFRAWPHLSEGEGHYLARLEKKGQNEECLSRERKKREPESGLWKEKTGLLAVRALLQEVLSDQKKQDSEEASFLCGRDIAWITERLFLMGEQVYRLPDEMPVPRGLRVLRPGLHIGSLKKNRLEPAHALAMALRPAQAARVFSCSAESDEIRRYLSGDTLPWSGAEKGWVLVCVEGCSAGWGKAVGGTLKNHYPKGLRTCL